MQHLQFNLVLFIFSLSNLCMRTQLVRMGCELGRDVRKHLTWFLKCPIKIADTFWPYFFGIPYKSLAVIPHAIVVLLLFPLFSFGSAFVFTSSSAYSHRQRCVLLCCYTVCCLCMYALRAKLGLFGFCTTSPTTVYDCLHRTICRSY